MNWLDILLLIIIGVSLVMSARRGFSREVIGLAATFFGLVFGMWFYGTAASLLLPYISSERLADLIGFLLVFFGTVFVGAVLGWIIGRFLSQVGLSFFDHLLGAAFGLARGVLIAMALLTAFIAFGPLVPSKAVINSQIAPYILRASRVLVAMAPMELKASFHKQYDQAQEAWRKG